MQTISPFLWFDDNAEEAAKFYTSVFKNSKIKKITRYPEEPAKQIGREPGSVMTVEFTLDGVEFVAFNAGATVQVHRSGVVRGDLRHPGGGRLLLGKIDRRRRRARR